MTFGNLVGAARLDIRALRGYRAGLLVFATGLDPVVALIPLPLGAAVWHFYVAYRLANHGIVAPGVLADVTVRDSDGPVYTGTYLWQFHGPHLITQMGSTPQDVLILFDPAYPQDAVVIDRSFSNSRKSNHQSRRRPGPERGRSYFAGALSASEHAVPAPPDHVLIRLATLAACPGDAGRGSPAGQNTRRPHHRQKSAAPGDGDHPGPARRHRSPRLRVRAGTARSSCRSSAEFLSGLRLRVGLRAAR